MAFKIWDPDTRKVVTRLLVRTAYPNKGSIQNRCLDPPESFLPEDNNDSGEENEGSSPRRKQPFKGGSRRSRRLGRANKTTWIKEDIKDLETRSNAFKTKPTSFDKKVGKVMTCWLVLVNSFTSIINTGEFQHIGPDIQVKGQIPNHRVLETTTPECPLLHKANMARLNDLQLLDMVDEDTDMEKEFNPDMILDHRVSIKPRRIITQMQNKDGTTTNKVKVTRESHLRVKVLWKNGEITWVSARALKQQNPFVFLLYGLAWKLNKHKHFSWVKDIIQNPDSIFSALKTSTKTAKEVKFKFGVQVSHNMKEAIHLDEVNNNKEWDGAVQSELTSINGHQKFIVLENHEPMPPGYKQIPYHFIPDVKFDGRKKARLVAGGHRAPEVDKEESYLGVVSIETI